MGPGAESTAALAGTPAASPALAASLAPTASLLGSGKRIALFLDGTWNNVDDNTNVWRAKSLFKATPEQICYYSAGVGTTRGERLIGGMFGYGLDDEVIRAYEWLTEHYEPDDRIFIFGFSRGAYTARALAGFISRCGLLQTGAPLSLNQLYDRYRKGSVVRSIRQLRNLPSVGLALEEKWLIKYSMAIPIWFQGVWDTVGALGVPFGRVPVISRSNYAFLETDLRINDAFAYHALAIDEHREAFAPTLWKRTVKQNAEAFPARSLGQVEQRWFVGAHADVGGGYPNGLLAQISLRWLMAKACSHGLEFKEAVDIDGNETQAAVNDSFARMAAGLYRLAKLGRPFYRTIGAPSATLGDETTTTINETIDGSVFDRWRGDSTYRPQNLQAWAKGHNVDIASLRGPVRADEPQTAAPDA
jgi:uncharacterized protein (DUF2235 family)